MLQKILNFAVKEFKQKETASEELKNQIQEFQAVFDDLNAVVK